MNLKHLPFIALCLLGSEARAQGIPLAPSAHAFIDSMLHKVALQREYYRTAYGVILSTVHSPALQDSVLSSRQRVMGTSWTQSSGRRTRSGRWRNCCSSRNSPGTGGRFTQENTEEQPKRRTKLSILIMGCWVLITIILGQM